MSWTLWEARKEECRRIARELLAATFVSQPSDIDVAALAFKAGRRLLNKTVSLALTDALSPMRKMAARFV